MRLQDVETYANNLPEALAKSKADVPGLESALREAEGRLAAAEQERQRWNRTFGVFVSRIPLLQTKAREAKVRVINLEAESGGTGDTASGWSGWRRLQNEADQAVATFKHFSVYQMEDAGRAHLVASIAERRAYAELLDGRSARARAGLLVAVQSAHDFDPGSSLELSNSWSSQESKKAYDIFTRAVPELLTQLQQHDERVDRLRSTMDLSPQ